MPIISFLFDITYQTETYFFHLTEYKTMNYLESNLISKDNSATPNLKSSQIRSMDEANFAAEDTNQDWLSCISTRTGLPRIFLSFTLFLSAVVMIWLCFTTAATAPDHYVKSQVGHRRT